MENPSPSVRYGELMADDGPKIDRYAVVGHPVSHSRSPMIHQLFAQQTGEAISYELLDAAPEDFEVAVRGFGAAGGRTASARPLRGHFAVRTASAPPILSQTPS